MTFWIIVCVVAVLVGWYKYVEAQALRAAQAAYAKALAELTGHPGDNNYRVAALNAGRHYAELARKAAGDKGVAVFDEVALSNDLSARSGTQTVANAENKQCPQCAEMVKAAAQVCRFCQHKFGQAA